ncbi:hypothetical protein ACYULU_02135 [Breznakiellaceae bacterium SP9]
MDMRPSGPFKEPRYQDFIQREPMPANRAYAAAVFMQAINAAPYMHESVFSPGHRREDTRQHPLLVPKFGRAHGAYFRHSGHTGS